MNWKYYIPHVFEDGDTTIWEDIYLCPDVENWEGPAYMLTVDAVDETSFAYHGMTHDELDELLGGELRDTDHYIDGDTLTIHAPHFDRPGLFKWAKVWLEQLGYTCNALVEVSFDEMSKWAVSHHFDNEERGAMGIVVS